jgi:hypothetical protein
MRKLNAASANLSQSSTSSMTEGAHHAVPNLQANPANHEGHEEHEV